MYANKELPPHGLDANVTGPNVLNRLQALFGSANAEAGPSRRRRPSEEIGEGLHRAITEPVMPVHIPEPVPDRDALLVKLVTWNMGDSLVSFHDKIMRYKADASAKRGSISTIG